MITLTQDMSRLALHANFEKVCELPEPKASINHFCDLVRASDPEFFSNNSAFEACYEDQYADFTDFDLMVHALTEIHVETLFEDNSSGVYNALRRFGFPALSIESKWGDYVQQLLDGLLRYWPQSSTLPVEKLDSNKIVDAVFVEEA